MIVRIVETPHDPTGLSDVLIGSLGLTGAIVLCAIVLGLGVAAVMFWIRSRHTLVIDVRRLSQPSATSDTSESR